VLLGVVVKDVSICVVAGYVLLGLVVDVLLCVVGGEVLTGPVVGVPLPLDTVAEDTVVNKLVLTAVEVVHVLVEPVPVTVKEELLDRVALEIVSGLVEEAVTEPATLVLLRLDSEVDAYE
jgi:hypothetical protein